MKLIPKYQKARKLNIEWIKDKDVNGNVGYRNIKTGQFRSTLSKSVEEKQKDLNKRNKAALLTYSSQKAKFDRTQAHRRNHSDETMKKVLKVPQLVSNKQGTMSNTSIQQNAPNEDSAQIDNTFEDLIIGDKLFKLSKGISKLSNNILDYKAIKGFNNRYNYGYNIKPTIIFDNNKLDKVYNHLIKQHNTFTRGVDPSEAIKWGRFPKNTNLEDAASYSLTHIPKATANNNAALKSSENALYTSNSIGLSQRYTNGNGYIGILERPTLPLNSFTNRRQALKAADFTFEPIPDNILSSTTDFPKQFMYAKSASVHSGNAYRIGNKWYKPLFNKVQSDQIVRGNTGTFPIPQSNMTDANFRHYLFVGNIGEQPLKLKALFPYKGNKSTSDFDYTSVGFTKKK